ncbi:MAG: hypothetical protein JKY29_05440 [Gammaproteobacteria bacterium]|nr:hypothetical protein [Gammaproteobacteria bacterium]
MNLTTQILIIWFGLITAASAQVKANDPLLSLNHFFVVVDETTYQDIQDNAFLKNTFAITQSRTTIRNDTEYSGFYVYGENTYFEIITKSLGTWQSGIFLSGDDEEDLERVKENNLPHLYISSKPVTREFEGEQIPWFVTAGNFEYPMASQLGFGIMEYHPQYLAQYYPDIEPQSRGVSRKEVLTRYAAIEGVSQSDRIFGNVVGITIAASPVERRALGRIFESLGFTPTATSNESILTGNNFELKILPRTNSISKITAVKLQLNRENTEEVTLEFGASSSLEISTNGMAYWRF